MKKTKEFNHTLDNRVIQHINLKLAALGYPVYQNSGDAKILDVAKPLILHYQEKSRLLANHYCPADRRILKFLNDYLSDVKNVDEIKLPQNTLILDALGLAREMSLPPDKDSFNSEHVESYRVQQGVLHNPKSDRRTTKGVFHIAEGGLPVPDDKKAVPKNVFANLMIEAVKPPKKILTLPFTSTQEDKVEVFVSLLLRPTVCPEVPGFTSKKSTEIRFFAPGSLVSNLDFVESIFGNGGDPYLPENDAALDVDHWTGHTGCVILAPHLIRLKKKDLGLPHYDKATERQRRDGMCWKDEKELYNDGSAFKITCRNEAGVMVTLIADNYFGYCKKEVKTQISYSSNLYGLAEEEHAGGAIAFPSYNLGKEFVPDISLVQSKNTFKEISQLYQDIMDLQPEGYGIDKQYSNIFYVPETAKFELLEQSVRWKSKGKEQKIKLKPEITYVLPSGYKVHMEKQTGGHYWRLIGVAAEGTFCHKPCTVSGGGKSEISKSIADAMIQGPVFVTDFHKDFEQVAKILKQDFGNRFREKVKRPKSRPILSAERSLGSVIKLFTPSETEFSDEHNEWLKTIPPHIRELIFVVKRYYKQEWKENWLSHFSVDSINGSLGHELKYDNQELVAYYMRVGFEKDGSYRIYKLRQDYNAAEKIQMEDDISASVVVPKNQLKDLNPDYTNESFKIVTNCETRLFQRPDDAIHRGYDKQAELDLSSPNTFLSNYEPLSHKEAEELLDDALGFDRYTRPMKRLIKAFEKEKKIDFFVSSAHPRIVEGKPSKNPRYLQNRLDLMNPRSTYLGEIGTRLFRKIPLERSVLFCVNSVLPGRRNNPPDKKAGIKPLAVYNPIHYQELPELFMDFVCSVTGKSPSTTGFGSEGALTKGPFNALMPVHDLNNTLVSYILTGYQGFTSAAGYIGPNFRTDHDITLLIPEIWSRMTVDERDPDFLIKNGYLEKVNDVEYKGQTVLASRLGYRITLHFVNSFLGRIFNNPSVIFDEAMLKPELQDLDIYVEGVENIVRTQKQVAQHYFNDGSIEAACPPLKALIYIMHEGTYNGKDLDSPEVRQLFTRDYLLKSDWYQQRLKTQQSRDISLWQRHVESLEKFLQQDFSFQQSAPIKTNDCLAEAKKNLSAVKSPAYLKKLVGTIGADPLFKG